MFVYIKRVKVFIYLEVFLWVFELKRDGGVIVFFDLCYYIIRIFEIFGYKFL